MFAEELRRVMVEKGVTQSELSKASGIGRSSICQYLAGKNIPEPDRVEQLARALGVNPEDLTDVPVIIRKQAPGRISRMTVREAAKAMGMTHETIKQGLIQGVFPWGYAIKTSADRYTFFINAKKFAEVEGLEVGNGAG